MHICIVSPRHISYNPRVVKEADCLHEAGYSVTVVAIRNNPNQARMDQELMSSRGWQLLTYDYRRHGFEWWNWMISGIGQRFFKTVSYLWRSPVVIERAAVRELAGLARLVRSVRADLYLAHHAEALPVAWKGARKHGGRLGFDAEDFHTGMDAKQVPREIWASEQTIEQTVIAILNWHGQQTKTVQGRNLEYIERRYLETCSSLTAASQLIAIAYRVKYGLTATPIVVNNVFPLENDINIQLFNSTAKVDNVVRLYWFSQVIGPGRGLEAAVAALELLPSHVELHLRGDVSSDFREKLVIQAKCFGADERLHFHSVVSAATLVQEAAKFDIGLALEADVEVNRLLCLTNKVFTYLNAGIPIVATATPGQAHLASTIFDVCVLCEPDDPVSLAIAVTTMLERLGKDGSPAVRSAARRIARYNFSWESEQKVLLESVSNALRGNR